MPSQSPKPVRVIVYIDGFNLYFGLKARGWTRFRWLNLQEVARRLLKPYQSLVQTKYFTARVKMPRDKQARQNLFIEALETLPGLQIFYGRYQINRRTCVKCHRVDHVANEKMTDVNIAAEMLADAFTDKFDTAILMSADADLSLAVKKITEMVGKRVVCVFPPERRSSELARIASVSFTLGRQHLANSLFPPEVKKKNGFVLRCPPSWMK